MIENPSVQKLLPIAAVGLTAVSLVGVMVLTVLGVVSEALVAAVVGTITGYTGGVYQFYYGSSAGSKAKTKILDAEMERDEPVREPKPPKPTL